MDNTTDITLNLYKNYTAVIKLREDCRKKAEDADKIRKAAWREFYRMTTQLDALEKELGVDDCPPAPKKKNKRVIDLTSDTE